MPHMNRCKTVQIVTAKTQDNPLGVVTINESDLQPEDVLFGAEAAQVVPLAPPVLVPQVAMPAPEVAPEIVVAPWAKPQ